MSIKTYSAFLYGHTFTRDNYNIDFDEGSGEITAKLKIGAFSISQMADLIAQALNFVGVQEYTVTLDRATRKFTISAASNFTLKVIDGTNVNFSAYQLLGFTSNKTGANSYESDIASGFIYEPQFLLQSFIDFPHDKMASSATVAQSSSGLTEVVKFGDLEFMSCSINWITNITPQIEIIDNPNGVEDAVAFMDYAITKAPLEFLPDKNDTSITGFTTCLLESTPSSSEGVGYTLREKYGEGLIDYYDLKNLKFRKIEV